MTARLLQLLDESRAAIRRADFAALENLTKAILAAADAPGASTAELAAVKAGAARNTVLLEAAAEGLRAARRRVTDIRAARAGLATYDGRGARQRLEPATPVSLRQRV